MAHCDKQHFEMFGRFKDLAKRCDAIPSLEKGQLCTNTSCHLCNTIHFKMATFMLITAPVCSSLTDFIHSGQNLAEPARLSSPNH